MGLGVGGGPCSGKVARWRACLAVAAPYAGALVAVLAATALTLACRRVGLGEVYFSWFFVAIVLAAGSGFATGVFASIAAGVATNYFIDPPTFQFQLDLADLMRTGLYIAVSVAISKIVRARRRAEAETRDREQILAYAAHELRNPLSAITGWAELIRRGTIPPARLQHAAEIILHNTKLEARIAQDLVELSRIAMGGLSLRPEELDAAQLISHCIAGARETAVSKGVAIEESLLPVKPIRVDRERISQVVDNLLANAVKFTPAGGAVCVQLCANDGRAVLTVSDTGDGIPEELLPQVFRPGVRHPGSRGFGLGLAIAKDIVERHGGTISVSSKGEGRGAAVRITLPIHG